MRQPLARDTAPAAEARQITFFQQRQPHERLALTFDLTAFAVASSRAALRRLHPDLDALAHARLFAALCFGVSYAERVRQPPTIEGTMSIPAALLPVTRTFAQLGIAYYISGSIASTAYSLPRVVADVDVAAALELHHVGPFVAALEADYYIDRGAVSAIRRLQAIEPVSTETARIARSAFPNGHRSIRLADELGTLFSDDLFATLCSTRGQPAFALWRCALVTNAVVC